MKPQSVQDAKLADFSLSAILSTSLIRKDYCGTMIYMAPEMLLGQPYSQPVDLYSLSVIMFELLEGRHPFFLRRMNSEAYVRAVTSELPVFKRRWSYLALSLYQRLARPDPRYRYTAS
jgi:aurora kinase, other